MPHPAADSSSSHCMMTVAALFESATRHTAASSICLRRLFLSPALLTALTGTEIDKKKVELPSAIKEFGSYDASVRLYAGVVASFKLKVEEL